jgi:glycosyltransferase involved in cell wall biosynthesis
MPAYNEAGVVGRVVRAVRTLPGILEVIVVDDASKDATGDEARRAGARVVRHPYNKGNGAAVKSGIRAARGEIVALMDADGQHDPADLRRLLDMVPPYDLVVGARDRRSHAGFHRFLANVLYNAFATYIAGTRIRDLTSGFRAMRRDLALRFLYLLPNRFSYPSTMTLSFIRAGHNVGFCPVQVHRRHGRSKIRPLRDGFRFLLIISRVGTFFSPLRIFVPLAFLSFGSGVGYAIYRIAFEGRRFTLAMGLLMLTGILFFLLGLISEQVASLRYSRIDE